MAAKTILAPPLYATYTVHPRTGQPAMGYYAVSSRTRILDWLMTASTAHGQTKP